MAMYYNVKKVRNLYFNGKCITRLALGKEMTRLVEGDDFVRAEWLKAQSTTYADMASLPISSYNVSFRVKWIRGQNYTYFNTDGYRYYRPHDSYAFAIWNVKEGNVSYFNPNIGYSDVYFDITSNSCTINGIDVPKYGFPISDVWIRANHADGFAVLYSSITVDGIERYIPCRLLHPIPATLDGNGIARNADECGMYNSVNGLFYGNVGSGSFSVSDD